MTSTGSTSPVPVLAPQEGRTPPHRLLVGADGSAESVEALRRAAGMAAAMGSTIRVVTCWTYPAFVDTYEALPSGAFEDGAGAVQLEVVRAVFGDAVPRGLETVVLQGAPALRLVEESRNADLLILGSRGRGGFMGLLLGSVSRACAEHADCDVLVVRGSRRREPGKRER